jgi:hypothetical protein
MYPTLQPKADHPMSSAALMMEIPRSEYKRYNAELEEYFAAYQAQVPLRSAYLDARARSFLFELILENNGSCPAEDIDVYVHISSDVIESVTTEDDNDLHIPSWPDLPEKPSSAISRMTRTPTFGDMNLRHLNFPQPMRNHEGVRWSRVDAKNGEFAIRVKVGRLKHTFTISLGSFRARFRSWESVRPIETRCSMTAGNHPKCMEHPLLLRVGCTDSLPY